MNEYTIVNTASLEYFVPVALLNPSVLEDAWYFKSIESRNEYDLNIGHNTSNDAWHLWINHKVFSEGDLVGIFCSGLRIPDVFDQILGNERNIRGYIINRGGIIQLSSAENNIYSGMAPRHIRYESADYAYAEALQLYLDNISGFFDPHSQPVILTLGRASRGYASFAPIVGSDWSVVVLYNNNILSDISYLLPLLTAILTALFLYVAGRNAVMGRLIFAPLGRLTQSISEGKLDANIYGSDRDDEIGELARTIRNTSHERKLHRDLLETINKMSAILLEPYIEKFESNLFSSMGMMAHAVKADRVYIWHNHLKNDILHATQLYEWSEGAEPQQDSPYTTDVPYTNMPGWEEALSQGKCINGVVRNLSQIVQAQLVPQGILSVLIVPVFVMDEFWGFVGFDDCHRDRIFTENEEMILRSGSLMIANAMLRNDMALDMQAANQAKSNFLAKMSHEMRTPLNAVLGLSELTMDAGGLDEEAEMNLSRIYNAGATLLSTVNDILDISKIEAGKLELLPAEYDIPSLINDTVTQSTMRVGEKPIHFILDLNPNLPTRLYGDDIRTKQIFNNLLSNAFKYTNEGVVQLTVSCEREGEAVWMTIRVSDTGIGIKSENISTLFSDYTQLDKIYHREIEGTGLGLPITKKIAEMMDGSISVESEYGKGSVFTVRIKQKFVTDDEIGEELVKNLKEFRYSDSKRVTNSLLTRIKLPYARVLVVDDVETNFDVAKGMMKPYNMQIDCVKSGQEAIDLIRAGEVRYNAIFMDHMMPGIDGLEATRIIREEIGTEYAKTVPVIALTANAIVGNEEMFLRSGFQAFLPKPIEVARLDSVIREWVRDEEMEKQFAGRLLHPNGEKLLDMRKGLERFSGDEESYIQVLRSFAANTPPMLKLMENVNRDNLAEYAIAAHGIKGSSRGICAMELGNQAEAIEKAAKEGNFNYVAANNKIFIESAWKLIELLDGIVKQADLKNKKPKRDKPDNETLKKLLAACETYNMDEVDAAMAELEAYEYESAGGLAAWLRENVDHMNFKQIVERLADE
jgi:signal transduction histidine kinase/DNA-binding response OmpR family regulator/HAMP domain-containing protein